MFTSGETSAEVSVITEKAASRSVISRSKRSRSMLRRKYGLRHHAGRPTSSHSSWPSTRASSAPYRCSQRASQTATMVPSIEPSTWISASRRTSMKPLITARM